MVVVLPASMTTRILFLHAGCLCFLLLSFRVAAAAAAAAAAASPSTSFSFDFSNTSRDYSQDLRFEGNAALNGDLVDLTCNSKDPKGNLFCKGRMSYSHPVQFYDNNTGEVTSFSTSFTFAIKPINGIWRGDGMAFFLAGYPSVLPPSSAGSWMGLQASTDTTNQPTSGSSRYVAVEFDTYYNPNWDPTAMASFDHIGIDLGSVTSVSTTRLPTYSLRGTMTATITFDNRTRILEATLHFDSNPSFGTAQVKAQLPEPLDALLPPEVAVGFSAGTGQYFELHRILSWSFSSTMANKDSTPGPKETPAETNGIQQNQDQPLGTKETPAPGPNSIQSNQDQTLSTRGGGRRRRRQATIIGGAGAPSLVALVAAVWSALSWLKWRGVRNLLATGNAGIKQFDYSDLNDATCGFSEETKIGSGSDEVYKGNLRDDGSRNDQPVAVKKMVRDSRKGGNKDFLAVLEAIGRINHRNVVRLEGWCYSVNKRNLLDFLCWCLRRRSLKLFLVYELVPNGNLHEHLHQRPDVLSWTKRYKIVNGIVSGLYYLHHQFEECILHGDIKPSNVFLDHDFNAKLGYFGLSRVIDGNETTTTAAGTLAYIDPLCRKDIGQVKFRPSSDIYSFGIVLLEIAHGENNPKLVRRLHTSQPDTFTEIAADKKLADKFDKTQMERVIILGLMCSDPDENQRPSMIGAMQFLEKGRDLCPATPEERRGVKISSSEVCALIFPSGASDMYRSPDQGL